MFDGLSESTAYVVLENPRWAGGTDGRVYGVDLVEFDADDNEIKRRYLHFTATPYYPQLSNLQDLVNRVNDGRIDPDRRR